MPEFTADDFARLVTLYVPETVTALAFSPDGGQLAIAAGDKVHIFRVPKPKAPASSDVSQSRRTE